MDVDEFEEPLKNAICLRFTRKLLDVCFPTTLCVSGSRQPATRVRRDNTLRLRRFLAPAHRIASVFQSVLYFPLNIYHALPCMAKELRVASLPHESDATERPTRPVFEMSSVLAKSRAVEPQREHEEKEFSLEHLKAFEHRASVVSRVLARALDSHRAGASADDLGKKLRAAQLKLHGADLAMSRPMINIANALEASSILTTGGMKDTKALEKLFMSVDTVADLSPDAIENFLRAFDEKMKSVVGNMKKRKQEIA